MTEEPRVTDAMSLYFADGYHRFMIRTVEGTMWVDFPSIQYHNFPDRKQMVQILRDMAFKLENSDYGPY